MRSGLFLSVSLAFGLLAVDTSNARPRPTAAPAVVKHPTTQAVVKRPPVPPPGLARFPRGAVGGPATKTSGITGLAKAGGINGTVKPKH
jgi:hypothetical protein